MAKRSLLSQYEGESEDGRKQSIWVYKEGSAFIINAGGNDQVGSLGSGVLGVRPISNLNGVLGVRPISNLNWKSV